MESKDYKNQLREMLNEVIEAVDNTYYLMSESMRREIIGKQEKLEEVNEETNRVYNQLTREACVKLIRTKLPLRVKLFNKISWEGSGIDRDDQITINFSFNGDYERGFKYTFFTEEIKKILKIK